MKVSAHVIYAIHNGLMDLALESGTLGFNLSNFQAGFEMRSTHFDPCACNGVSGLFVCFLALLFMLASLVKTRLNLVNVTAQLMWTNFYGASVLYVRFHCTIYNLNQLRFYAAVWLQR